MNRKFAIKFIGYWVVNTLVVSLANSFFPNTVVLGNAYLGAPAASVFAGFLITALLLMAKGLARTRSFMIKGRAVMFVYYWGAATVATWLVARIATVSGFGIARFTWAIGIGLAISSTNWLLRQVFKGMKMI